MTTLKTLKDMGIDFDDTIGVQKDELIDIAKNWISYLSEQKELLDMSAGGFDDISDKPLEKFFKKEMINSQIKWIRKFFNIE